MELVIDAGIRESRFDVVDVSRGRVLVVIAEYPDYGALNLVGKLDRRCRNFTHGDLDTPAVECGTRLVERKSAGAQKGYSSTPAMTDNADAV